MKFKKMNVKHFPCRYVRSAPVGIGKTTNCMRSSVFSHNFSVSMSVRRAAKFYVLTLSYINTALLFFVEWPIFKCRM